MKISKSFSIRAHLNAMKCPERKASCMYLHHVVRVIKDHTGEGSSYINKYYECLKRKCRISGRKACLNCKMYQALPNTSIGEADEKPKKTKPC